MESMYMCVHIYIYKHVCAYIYIYTHDCLSTCMQHCMYLYQRYSSPNPKYFDSFCMRCCIGGMGSSLWTHTLGLQHSSTLARVCKAFLLDRIVEGTNLASGKCNARMSQTNVAVSMNWDPFCGFPYCRRPTTIGSVLGC